MSDEIIKAGAVIISSKNKAKIALIYRDRLNDWTFPKGHIEQGESAREAMLREVQEETGLTVKILGELPDHFYTNKNEGKVVTKMFLVISYDDSKLKNEYENDEVKWISHNDVTKKLTHDNLKEYFNLILPLIKNYINF